MATTEHRNAYRIRTRIAEWVQSHQGLSSPVVERGGKGAIIGALNDVLGGDDLRHMVLWFLFTCDTVPDSRIDAPVTYVPKSTKELNEDQWWALFEWVGFWYDEEEGKWHYGDTFAEEALICLVEALAIVNLRRRNHYLEVIDELDLPEIVKTAIGELDGRLIYVETDEEGELHVKSTSGSDSGTDVEAAKLF